MKKFSISLITCIILTGVAAGQTYLSPIGQEYTGNAMQSSTQMQNTYVRNELATARDTIKLAVNKISVLREQCAKLSAELATKSSEITQLRSQMLGLQNAEAKCQSLQREVDLLRGQYKDGQAQNQALRARLAAAETNAQAVKDMQTRLEVMHKESETLRGLLAKADNKAIEAANKAEALEKQLSEAKIAARQLKEVSDRKTQLSLEVVELKKHRDEMSKKIQILCDTVNTYKELEKSLSSIQAEKKMLKGQLSETKSLLESREKEFKQVFAEKDKLTAELEKTIKNYTTIQAELSKVGDALTNKEKELKQRYEEELVKSNMAKEKAIASIKELEKRINVLSSEKSEFANKVKTLTSQYDAAIKDKQVTEENLINENRGLHKKLEELEQNRQAAADLHAKQTKSAQNKLAETETALLAAENAATMLRNKIQETEKTNANAYMEIKKRLESVLDEKDTLSQQVLQLQKELSAAKESAQSAPKEVVDSAAHNTLKAEHEKLKKVHAELINKSSADAKNYAAETEARKREIEELKQKLEEANTKNASLCQALDDNQKSSKIASQNFTAQQEKLVTAETRIAELEQLIVDKSKLEEELNAAKSKISSQAEQLTVCKEEYITLREKMQSEALANAKQEDAKIQQLQKLLDEAKSAKEGLIGELNAKADRISELESELGKSCENQEKLNAAIRKLQEEQTSLKEAAREEAAKSKASEVSELTSEIEALKRALEEKTTVISDQQVALSNMERALEVNRKNQTPSVKVYSEQKEETVKVQAGSSAAPKGKITHTPNEILHKMFENN